MPDPNRHSSSNPRLLDDFYTECDEHLADSRRVLIAMEDGMGQRTVDPELLGRLFRSFHSLKGLSAMAGVRPAEQLAHQTEGYLRALRDRTVTFSREGLDVLILAVQQFEQTIAAHRQEKTIPDPVAVLAKLVQATPVEDTQSGDRLKEEVAAKSSPSPEEKFFASVADAQSRGERTWRCTFSPSPALDAKGINLNYIRTQLSTIGNILKASPSVRPEGKISFEFVLAANAGIERIQRISEEGLAVEPYQSGDERQKEDAALLDQRNVKQTTASFIQEHSTEAAGVERSSNGASIAFAAPSHVVRVDLGRLDDLMRLVGEMVIQRARLEEQITRLSTKVSSVDMRGLHEVNLGLVRQLRDLRDGLMRVRMVRIGEVFERMPFVVRDLAREEGKEIKLELAGQDTEIDKYLVERLMDPLLHLVRNAVSHAIEKPQERLAAGKPVDSVIRLSASSTGETVQILVEDDGRGVDKAKVLKRAQDLGLPVPEQVSPVELLDLICSPGFSTREEADRISGRGVGMAVVKNTIQELGGVLSLETVPGHGTIFSLRLPLTLAIADALIVVAGGQRFAMPQGAIREIIQMEPGEIRHIESNELIQHRNSVLPLIHLARVFHLKNESQKSYPVLILENGGTPTGLVTDTIVGQREIVVRPMRDPLVSVPGVSGATELGDGRAVLILDPAALVGRIRQFQRNTASVDLAVRHGEESL